MKSAIKLCFFAAMASMACLLAGIGLSYFEHLFPSTKSPIQGPGNTEIFIASTEGLTLAKIGMLGFIVFSIACLALVIVRKARKSDRSA